MAVQAHTPVAVFAALLALEGSICGCLVRSTFPFKAIFVRGLLQVSFSCFQPGSQRLSLAGPVFGEFLPTIYVEVKSFDVSLADIFVPEVGSAWWSIFPVASSGLDDVFGECNILKSTNMVYKKINASSEL